MAHPKGLDGLTRTSFLRLVPAKSPTRSRAYSRWAVARDNRPVSSHDAAPECCSPDGQIDRASGARVAQGRYMVSDTPLVVIEGMPVPRFAITPNGAVIVHKDNFADHCAVSEGRHAPLMALKWSAPGLGRAPSRGIQGQVPATQALFDPPAPQFAPTAAQR